MISFAFSNHSVVPQQEIDKILKRVDEKYNPKIESLNQNFAGTLGSSEYLILEDFKRTLDQYQDAQTKIKNEIKSMESLISAGADPSKVDISQYLNQVLFVVSSFHGVSYES